MSDGTTQPAGAKQPSFFNRTMMALLGVPVLGNLLGRGITVLTYTGRTSGKVYRMPIGYKQSGDVVTLQSNCGSEEKSWWRNFLGDGGPVSVLIDGADRRGHAVATRSDDGKVTVNIELEPAGAAK